MRMTDAAAGWATGAGGTALRTIDGGRTWSAADAGTDSDLRAAVFPWTTSGWLVGDDGCLLGASPRR
jgi:photosystem II stability/assembly factor-like uncharacterized protein